MPNPGEILIWIYNITLQILWRHEMNLVSPLFYVSTKHYDWHKLDAPNIFLNEWMNEAPEARTKIIWYFHYMACKVEMDSGERIN